METTGSVSLVSGPPLETEPGLGSLTLPGFLREVTGLYRDREALVARSSHGVTRWTYAQLWDRSLEVARALRASGIGKDGRVGVLMTNRPEWIAAVFGTWLAGGVAVAFSTFSTPPELDHLLRVSGVSVLLLEGTVLKRDFAAELTELEPRITSPAPGGLRSPTYPFLRHLAVVGAEATAGALESWDEFRERGEAEPRELVEASADAVQPSDTAALFFSSGSASLPKGILNSHRAIAIQLWRFRRMYGFAPEDEIRGWSANGFFWSGNFAMSLGATFASGGSLVLQPTFVPTEALELFQAERVNFPFAWPHQWAQLESAPNWASTDLSSVRYVDVETPITRHPTVSTTYTEPNHAYGNTETFTISTCFPANTPEEVIAGSSGIALPGTTIKIVDPLTGEILPRGTSGEICVRSATLMLGYLGVPLSETLDATGFFRTGDGGYLDQTGRLYWEGRLTDIIKTGGANVSPREVDEALADIEGIKMAHTVGLPHDTLGEIVVACVVAQDEAVLDADAIRRRLRERLASYKVPRHILFCDEDDIQLTGSAKIKSSELRELAAKRLQTTGE